MDISVSKQSIREATDKMNDAVKHLEEELRTFRAGKANLSLLYPVEVDYYGTLTPLSQVASITAPDQKTILIQPWEKRMIPIIEKAIFAANIGYTPQNNGEQIRINIPPMTEESRKDLVKRAKAEGETAKMSIRNARRECMEAHKKFKKEGLPEDCCSDADETIQRETDSFNKRIDEIISAKEKEIMTV
ncbi:MAG: ribosome recycling factor [Bacteroidales bacterium]|jgi:ribosome recycling factor|nr:ribosome recycling factor [Bacteroidales bacterium]